MTSPGWGRRQGDCEGVLPLITTRRNLVEAAFLCKPPPLVTAACSPRDH